MSKPDIHQYTGSLIPGQSPYGKRRESSGHSLSQYKELDNQISGPYKQEDRRDKIASQPRRMVQSVESGGWLQSQNSKRPPSSSNKRFLDKYNDGEDGPEKRRTSKPFIKF